MHFQVWLKEQVVSDDDDDDDDHGSTAVILVRGGGECHEMPPIARIHRYIIMF